jgi:hypothetical protein
MSRRIFIFSLSRATATMTTTMDNVEKRDLETPPPPPLSDDEDDNATDNATDEQSDFIDSLLATEELTFKKCFNKEMVYEDCHNKQKSTIVCSNSDFSFGGKKVTFCPNSSAEFVTTVTDFLKTLQEPSSH